jgi:hypothetical protein
MATYQWRDGARYAPELDPQVCGERLEELREENGGSLTPEAVVADARKRTSPLHGAFEWSDRVAAHQYRLEQARLLLRSIEILDLHPQYIRPARAYYAIPADNGQGRVYQASSVVLSDTAMRERLLEQARRELAAFRRKYEQLEELAQLFEAIDQAMVLIGVGPVVRNGGDDN